MVYVQRGADFESSPSKHTPSRLRPRSPMHCQSRPPKGASQLPLFVLLSESCAALSALLVLLSGRASFLQQIGMQQPIPLRPSWLYPKCLGSQAGAIEAGRIGCDRADALVPSVVGAVGRRQGPICSPCSTLGKFLVCKKDTQLPPLCVQSRGRGKPSEKYDGRAMLWLARPLAWARDRWSTRRRLSASPLPSRDPAPQRGSSVCQQ